MQSQVQLAAQREINQEISFLRCPTMCPSSQMRCSCPPAVCTLQGAKQEMQFNSHPGLHEGGRAAGLQN